MLDDDNVADYEAEHVHAVYEQIASHFSSTRYKPWPIVSRFLASLPPGAIGLDVGCGNGKNLLAARRDVFILASDRSAQLARIAASPDRATFTQSAAVVVVADALALPHPHGRFDFAISIAVVHHLASEERRVAAVRSLLGTLRSGEVLGRVLISVWALEQSASRRGWSEGDEQDVMVPWVMRMSGGGTKSKGRKAKGGKASAPVPNGKGSTTVCGEEGADADDRVESKDADGSKVFHRYYHLYREGELERDITAAGGVVVESGYEKDNWWAVAVAGPDIASSSVESENQ